VSRFCWPSLVANLAGSAQLHDTAHARQGHHGASGGKASGGLGLMRSSPREPVRHGELAGQGVGGYDTTGERGDGSLPAAASLRRWLARRATMVGAWVL
jgi:hypothetical protein